MPPDEESQGRNGDAGERDEVIAEDAPASEAGDHFVDDPHGRQDHDVDGRMRVEPKQMLKEQRIPAEPRIEDPDVKEPLQTHQQDGDGDHRRPQDHDEARRIVRPNEEREPKPRHPRRAHLVNGHQEVQPRQDRGESRDEDPHGREHDVRVRVGAAVGRVERPARVHAPEDGRRQGEQAAERVDVPAQQVQARKGQIPRADHERHQEIPEHGRNRRDEEEEDHDDPVHGEEPIVRLRLHEIARRRHQLQANEDGEEASEEEEERDREQIEQGDPLMIGRQQPRPHTIAHIQVIHARRFDRRCTHRCPPSAPSDLR